MFFCFVLFFFFKNKRDQSQFICGVELICLLLGSQFLLLNLFIIIIIIIIIVIVIIIIIIIIFRVLDRKGRSLGLREVDG